MNMFILMALRGLLALLLAAAIAVAGAAAYAWAFVQLSPGGASGPGPRADALALFPIWLAVALPSSAGGLYAGLRIAWARPRKREPWGAAPWILFGIPLFLLLVVLWLVLLAAPLAAAVGALTALSTAKLLGPGSFPLTPRSRRG